MIAQNDWHLHGQQDYLIGVTLIRQPWRPADPRNDHDHCEFCWEKFVGFAGCLHEGYATEDRRYWICEECFRDIRERFQWRVK